MSKQWFQVAALGLVLCAGAMQVRADDAAPAADQNSTITLHLRDVLPEDAFAAFGKKAGVRFYTQPNELWDQPQYQQPVQVDIEKQSFWPALKQICDATKLYPTPYQNSGKRINLQGNDSYNIFKGRSYAKDQFLFILNSISTNRSLNMEHPETLGNQQLNIQFNMFVDPKLRLSRLSTEVRFSELKDESGLSLLPENYKTQHNGGGRYESPREMTYQISSGVALPANAGKKIAILKGAIEAVVLKKSEKWIVKDITNADNVVKDFGSCTYTIKKVTKDSGGSSYRVEISREGGSSDVEGTPDMVSPNNGNVILRDSKGHIWKCNGWGGGNNTQTWNFYLEQNGSRSVNTTSETKPTPEQLEMEVPVEVENIVVPIEFKNIPLP